MPSKFLKKIAKNIRRRRAIAYHNLARNDMSIGKNARRQLRKEAMTDLTEVNIAADSGYDMALGEGLTVKEASRLFPMHSVLEPVDRVIVSPDKFLVNYGNLGKILTAQRYKKLVDRIIEGAAKRRMGEVKIKRRLDK